MKQLSRVVSLLLFPVISILSVACSGGREAAVTEVSVGSEGDYPTLRAALDAAGEGPVSIRLTDRTHTESGIVLTGQAEIRGRLMGRTVLQAAAGPDRADDRVLTVAEGARGTLRDLIIRHGRTTVRPKCGAGILNRGELVLDRVDVRDNRAVHGAGIWNDGLLTIRSSRILDNRTIPPTTRERVDGTGCTGSGGGIKNEKGGYLILENSVVSGNTSLRRGGGIFIACESTMDIRGSVIAGNESSRSGGGLHNRGDLFLNRTIVTGNDSVREGNGLYNMGHLDLVHSLLVWNDREDLINGSGGGGFYGGGFLNSREGSWIGRGRF